MSGWVLVTDEYDGQSDDLSELPGAGIGGIILKLTEGLGSAGGYRAAVKAQAAAARGIQVLGGYDFGVAGDDFAAEFDLLQARMDTLGVPVAAPCLDAETAPWNGSHPSPGDVLAFGRRAVQHGWIASGGADRRPLLYGSAGVIGAWYGGFPEIASLYRLWVAAYTWHDGNGLYQPTYPPACPAPFSEFVGWQFSDNYPVQGGVDCSIFDPAVFTAGAPHGSVPQEDSDMDMLVGQFSADSAWGYYKIPANTPTALLVQGDRLVSLWADPATDFGVPHAAATWRAEPGRGDSVRITFIAPDQMARVLQLEADADAVALAARTPLLTVPLTSSVAAVGATPAQLRAGALAFADAVVK